MYICLIFSSIQSRSTEALRLKLTGAALQSCRSCSFCCFLFSADYISMTLLLSNTESLLKQTKQARQYCHYLSEYRGYNEQTEDMAKPNSDGGCG